MRRGALTSSAVSPVHASMTAQPGHYVSSILAVAASCSLFIFVLIFVAWVILTGTVKERSDREDHIEADERPPDTVVSASRQLVDVPPSSTVTSSSSVFLALCAPQLQRCNTRENR